MVTPYCSVNQWAKRHGGYDTFAEYTAAVGSYPSEGELQEALEDSTNTMNDTVHLNTSTNITDTRHTERLEEICSKMADRKLDIPRARSNQGGNFGIQAWSQADFLMSHERVELLNISKIKKKRRVARVVF